MTQARMRSPVHVSIAAAGAILGLGIAAGAAQQFHRMDSQNSEKVRIKHKGMIPSTQEQDPNNDSSTTSIYDQLSQSPKRPEETDISARAKNALDRSKKELSQSNQASSKVVAVTTIELSSGNQCLMRRQASTIAKFSRLTNTGRSLIEYLNLMIVPIAIGAILMNDPFAALAAILGISLLCLFGTVGLNAMNCIREAIMKTTIASVYRQHVGHGLGAADCSETVVATNDEHDDLVGNITNSIDKVVTDFGAESAVTSPSNLLQHVVDCSACLTNGDNETSILSRTNASYRNIRKRKTSFSKSRTGSEQGHEAGSGASQMIGVDVSGGMQNQACSYTP